MTYLELYEKALNDLEHNKITLGEFEERIKPLNQESINVIKELEQIRAEIEEKEFKLNCATISDVALKTAYTEVAKLIDKHISELKGENK